MGGRLLLLIIIIIVVVVVVVIIIIIIIIIIYKVYMYMPGLSVGALRSRLSGMREYRSNGGLVKKSIQNSGGKHLGKRPN
jgi:uncharacterized membrane protein YqiK